jgi:oxygen-independent coproporphyrinogen-3 oxidase
VRKCPYCDFNSHAVAGEIPEDAYTGALLADLRRTTKDINQRPLTSIFFGGGTPSLFRPENIDRVIEAAEATCGLTDKCEITLEANPGTTTASQFHDLRTAGVNRLSIGVQSFDDRLLKRLGRIHSSTAAVTALTDARAAGFDNLSLDLMFGLPGQSIADLASDIDQALRLEPEHISLYQLTLEEGTPFHAHPPSNLPDEDTLETMQALVIERLQVHGIERYEVSNFARDGFRCQHNLNYWQYGDYLGIGAGAHAKLTGSDGIKRYAQPADPATYIRQTNAGETCAARAVSSEDAWFEFLLNGLRLTDGVTMALFEARTGLPAAQLRHNLQPALQRGWLSLRDDRVRPTEFGGRFLDSVLAELLPERG